MTATVPHSVDTARFRWRWLSSFDSLILAVALLLAWEVGVRIGKVPAYLLPPPSMIVTRIISDYRALLMHTAVTMNEVVIGFRWLPFWPSSDRLSERSIQSSSHLRRFRKSPSHPYSWSGSASDCSRRYSSPS